MTSLSFYDPLQGFSLDQVLTLHSGKYANTCRKCQMDPAKPTHLWCQCRNKEKEWKGTSIDLSKYIIPQHYALMNSIFLGYPLHLVSHDENSPLVFPPLLSIPSASACTFGRLYAPPLYNSHLHSSNYTALLFRFKPQLTPLADDHISNNDGTICCKKNCGTKN